jgi:hypothetical protein
MKVQTLRTILLIIFIIILVSAVVVDIVTSHPHNPPQSEPHDPNQPAREWCKQGHIPVIIFGIVSLLYFYKRRVNHG